MLFFGIKLVSFILYLHRLKSDYLEIMIKFLYKLALSLDTY
jgi:hypothetical protein